MTELIEAMLRKAEADITDMSDRLMQDPEGPDAAHLRERIAFHHGQVSGLRHALFAVRQLDKEKHSA